MKNSYFYKASTSNIYKSPSKISEITSQLLYGEKFKILSKNKNWFKIKTSFDNYIGYIGNKDFTNNHKPTHKVFILKASIFNKLSNKTKYFLPFGSRISIIQENKNFMEFENNKWIKKKHIKKINHREKDYLKILKLFLGTRYIWGGKTYKGIDCSAILQMLYYYNNKLTYFKDKYEEDNNRVEWIKRELPA